MSTVTVIVGCTRDARAIQGCLDSILSQSGVDLDVLLVDDGSSDWTSAVAQAAARVDSRVTVVREEGGRARGSSRDRAAVLTSGEYTVALCVRDRLAPGSLARAARVLDTHPQVGLVYGRTLSFESDDDLPQARCATAAPQVWRGRDWIAQCCRTPANRIYPPAVVMRTSLQAWAGGYDAIISSSGDLGKWLRLAIHADVAFLCGADQAYRRAGSDPVALTPLKSRITDLRQRKASFDSLFEGEGRDLPRAESLHSHVNRALAREALSSVCRFGENACVDPQLWHELETFASEAYVAAGAVALPSSLRWRRGMRSTLTWRHRKESSV